MDDRVHISLKHGTSTLTVVRGTQWSEIDKNTLPTAEITIDGDTTIPSFKGWGLNEQKTKEDIYKEIPGDTPFNASSTPIYPWFDFDNPTQTIQLKMVKKEGQVIKGGVETIEVPYKAGSTENKTFGEVNKPQVTQGNLVFEGYYQDADCKTPWNDKTLITNEFQGREIYVNMVETTNDVAVNFVKAKTETEEITFTTATELKCARGTKLSDIAPKAYKAAMPNPSKEYGYLSKYYFVQWHNYADDSVVNLDSIIDNPITLYPEFADKKDLTFNLNEEEDPKTEIVKVDPTGYWRDVVQPTADPVTGAYFVNWQVAVENSFAPEGYSYTDAKPEMKMSEILLDKPVKPQYIEAASCHQIIVSTTAYLDDGTQTGSTKENMVYKGSYVEQTKTYEFGVPVSDKDIYFNSINKPFVPCSPLKDPTTEKPGVDYNDGITFNNEWQLSTDGTSYNDITADTKIAASKEKSIYYIRPKVSEMFEINFNAGTEGKIKEGDITKTKTSRSKTFGELTAPIIEPNEGYIFVGWKLPDGSAVTSSTKFNEATTLTASYKSDQVETSIHYHIIAEDDYSELEGDFPATPINDINDFQVTKLETKAAATDHKFSDFTYLGCSRNYYKFVGWAVKDSSGDIERGSSKYKLIDDDTVITKGNNVHLYAIFEEDGSYIKMTIKDDSGYEIVGSNTVFAQINKEMPFNISTQSFNNSTTTVKKVGKKVAGWKDKDGNEITTVQNHNYDDIQPIWADWNITVEFECDATAGETFSNWDGIARSMPYYDTLAKYLKSENPEKFADGKTYPTPNKPGQAFDHWAIKSGDKLLDINDSTKVEANIKLVPVFIETEVFKYSNYAYYYDETLSEWVKIKSFISPYESNKMAVETQSGKEFEVVRSSFNKEVRLGLGMEKVPDYFMYGCSSWTNDNKPLTIPAGVREIGKDVMYGCAKFNSQVNINLTSKDNIELKIGQNFMRQCYSFNSNIYITNTKTEQKTNDLETTNLLISSGFMFDCRSFQAGLYLNGWDHYGFLELDGTQILDTDGRLSAAYFYDCLSTTMNPALKFKVHLPTSQSGGVFETLFPAMSDGTTGYYRNIGFEYDL